MKRIYLLLGVAGFAVLAGLGWSAGQQSDIVIKLVGSTKPAVALPDFRGAGGAAQYAEVFNKTVFDDVQRAGVFTMAPKSFYPLNPPQQESDLRVSAAPAQPERRNAPPPVAKDCG